MLYKSSHKYNCGDPVKKKTVGDGDTKAVYKNLALPQSYTIKYTKQTVVNTPIIATHLCYTP